MLSWPQWEGANNSGNYLYIFVALVCSLKRIRSCASTQSLSVRILLVGWSNRVEHTSLFKRELPANIFITRFNPETWKTKRKPARMWNVSLLVRLTPWSPVQNSIEAILACHPALSTQKTGLGGKIVWTMTYSHRPHPSVVHWSAHENGRLHSKQTHANCREISKKIKKKKKKKKESHSACWKKKAIHGNMARCANLFKRKKKKKKEK